MNETALFGLLDAARNMTLASLNAVSEEMADRQPEGFNNTIRWNLGHIYLSLNNLVYGFAGEKAQTPDGFEQLFGRGTKPADWGELAVPSIAELKELLAAQPDEIEKTFRGRLNERCQTSFGFYETGETTKIWEMMNFAIFHEGLHLGFINGIKRALGVETLYSE